MSAELAAAPTPDTFGSDDLDANLDNGSTAAAAFSQRVQTAAALIFEIDPVVSGLSIADAPGAIFEALVRFVHCSLEPEHLWLLLLATTGRYPNSDNIDYARRRFETMTATDACFWLLAELRRQPACTATFEVVADAVIVETDFSARYDLHTGIQRVVRSTVPLWLNDKPATAAAWDEHFETLRPLTERETHRLTQWTGEREPADAAETDRSDAPQVILVPWRSVIALVEVSPPAACPRLAAIAQHTSNRTVAIGYDCIPIVSADLLDPIEPTKFVTFLEVIKHSRAVAGISICATAEFQGFADMLPSQGLAGPRVFECALPVDGVGSAPKAEEPGDRLVVLCVGSIDRRKNQLAVLHAAENLWRAGLDFRLRFIGGGGESRLFDEVHVLRRRGRAVAIETAVSEADLASAYAQAYFTVFASLHEGYGLPVAESLAYGVPAITSNFGSTREIGDAGGVEFVDPRDDADIERAMRLLLTDPARHAQLVEEISRRESRSWAQYATELWDGLVQPELDAIALDSAAQAAVQ